MFPKLNRDTLAVQVADGLIEFIKTSDLKPGDKLPSEQKLAENFGVSRPVIREALKVLDGRGVIEVSNGRSATVKPLGSEVLSSFFQWAIDLESKGVIELMEVRRGIEVQSAILAARRRTSKALEQMTRTVAKMRSHLHQPEAYAEQDVEFHLQVASASQNSMLYYLVESIRNSLREAIRIGLSRRGSEEELERVQQLHEEILAALEQGDADEAGRAMAAHFDDAVAAITLPARKGEG